MTWIRRNLFADTRQSVLTIVFGAGALYAVYRLARFVFVTGRWDIIRRNVTRLLVGLYPRTDLWRVWVAMVLLAVGVAVLVGAVRGRALVFGTERRIRVHPVRRAWPVGLLVAVLFSMRPSLLAAIGVAGVVLAAYGAFRVGTALGGSRFREVLVTSVVLIGGAYAVLVIGGAGPSDWGGLMLTLALAASGIILSFPLGVLLALGRRSSLPAVRMISTAYIELIRGVPLLTVLFTAYVVVLFLFAGSSRGGSTVIRAMIAFVLFTAAYIAEIVRGGLEAVGRGQSDAALAVGLGPVSTLRFVVLPQALRAVIPGLVGQFITLFKDTSLAAIITLTELLGESQRLTSHPDYLAQGLHAETLAFASFIYWTIAYTMSRESQRLELRLGVGTR